MDNEYIYKIEAHAHTYPASMCSKIIPEQMAEIYKENGYSAIVITNHFYGINTPEAFLKDYEVVRAHGEKCGLNVILGMELKFDNYMNDYLIYGIDEDDVKKISAYTGKTIKEFYTEFKNDRNLILQAHPFRDGMAEMPMGYIDGIEVFNMCPAQNSRVALAAKFVEQHKDFVVVGGSDFHYSGYEAVCATLTKTLPKDSFEFAEILKSGEYKFQIGDFIVERQ